MLGESHLQAGYLILSGLATTLTLTVILLRTRRGSSNQENKNSPEDDFEEINSHLQTDLNNKILDRINEVKREIKARNQDLSNNVKNLLSQQEAEVLAKQSEFEIAKDVIECKYKEKIKALTDETESEISEMKEALRGLRIILASSRDTVETVAATKSELECPVCLEEMKPPRR